MKITIEIPDPPEGWEWQDRAPRKGELYIYYSTISQGWLGDRSPGVGSGTPEECKYLICAYEKECPKKKWNREVKEWAKKHNLNKGYIAMDSTGCIYFYEKQPYIEESRQWYAKDSKSFRLDHCGVFISEPPQCNCSWEDSLVEIGGEGS